MRDRNRKYVPNPFFDDQEDLISDVDELLDRYGMDDMVRGRGPRQGLDKMARAFRSDTNGVYGSQFRRSVRPEQRVSLPSVGQFTDDDYEPRNARGSLVYKDPDYYRNEYNDEDDLMDIDIDAEFMYNLTNPEEDELEGRKFDLSDDMDMDEDLEEDDDMMEPEMEDEESEEMDSGENSDVPKYEGTVRAVKGAYLVSRKEQADETFTEIWIYNVGKDFDSESNVRKAILAGTDVDPTKNVSEDGTQEAVLKSIGNVQFLTVTGLPS